MTQLTPQQQWMWILGGGIVVALLYTNLPKEYGNPILLIVGLVIFFGLVRSGAVCFTPGCKAHSNLPPLAGAAIPA